MVLVLLVKHTHTHTLCARAQLKLSIGVGFVRRRRLCSSAGTAERRARFSRGTCLLTQAFMRALARALTTNTQNTRAN